MSEYFSDLESAREIKIKRSKNRNGTKSAFYHLLPYMLEIELPNGEKQTIFKKEK
jgi:hypothetical protein